MPAAKPGRVAACRNLRASANALSTVSAAGSATLVRDAVTALAGSALSADVRLHADPAAGLPTIVADPDRLAEVLRNLIANAIRYTPNGGTVLVDVTAPDPSKVAFLVTDSGAGLAPGEA